MSWSNRSSNREEPLKSFYVTASGVVTTDTITVHEMLLGTDGVNDPTIILYSGTSTTGVTKFPETTFDASLMGLSGFMGKPKTYNGMYAKVTCTGDVQILIFYREGT